MTPDRANGGDRPARIVLFTYAAAEPFHAALMDMAQSNLVGLGWRDARFRRVFGGRDLQALPGLARDIVACGPDIVLSFMTNANLAMAAATQHSPVPVVGWSMDLDGACLTGPQAPVLGNLTGVTLPVDYQRDQLRLLRALKPGLRRIGHLFNPSYAVANPALAKLRQAAVEVGIEVEAHLCAAPTDLAASVARLADLGVEALTVGPHEMFNANGAILAAAALSRGLPAIGLESLAMHGGVAGYAPDFPAIWQQGARMADQVLRGVAVTSIPVDRTIAPRLILNLGAIRALGLEVPEYLLAAADRVVDS